jgi:hypothetical protein
MAADVQELTSFAVADGRSSLAICGSGSVFDEHAPGFPVGGVPSVEGHAPDAGPDGTVEGLAKDVGMSRMAHRVHEPRRHDVEQRDLFIPPRHKAPILETKRFVEGDVAHLPVCPRSGAQMGGWAAVASGANPSLDEQ